MKSGDPGFFGITAAIETTLLPALTLPPNAPGQKLGLTQLRKFLADSTDALHQAFKEGQSVRQLVAARAFTVDQVLYHLWSSLEWPADCQATLIAVGGYGRAELFPHSDVDILILLADEKALQRVKSPLESFVTSLWDLKLDVGHSVRTLKDSEEQAHQDITIATNLLETRKLTGDQTLYQKLQDLAYSDKSWKDIDFFKAKVAEQKERHQRYGDSEYNLEPNIKTCPGGLRDIQTIGWIAKRHLGLKESGDIEHRFHVLTDDERNTLDEAEGYLWYLRYGLQMLAKRNENRLLFDYQRSLADQLGFQESNQALAVEQLMQKYYRYSMALSEINDVLLQHFDEDIMGPQSATPPQPLGRRFRIRNEYLEVTNPQIFVQSPFAMTEIFLHLAQHPEVKGIRASTIRALRAHRHLIDDNFRKDLANTSLFMEIMRTPHAVHETLSMMRKYGILGNYIPAFGRIIGQMQHDLFHIYTVDAHTIRVIRNMVMLYKPESMASYPLASWLINRLPKPELLFIAGLFHDIAKGRGGDHSELGAVDAEEFCKRHHLSNRDTSLVCWLVHNHLLMSMTAQRKDPSDPGVIQFFASLMQSQVHLDYLYVLTVCDISATNPTLWNTWRAALLRQLYTETVRVMRRGVQSPQKRSQWIQATRHEVREMLKSKSHLLPGTPFPEADINKIWDQIDEEYFLQDSTVEIAWQLSMILSHRDPMAPLIAVKDAKGGAAEGFFHIMVYMHYRDDLFAALTASMEQMHLNIVEARMNRVGPYAMLANFVVTGTEGFKPSQTDIANSLSESLKDPENFDKVIRRRVPRQLKHFLFPTEVTFSNDTASKRTVMEVVTPDRPGLLAKIALILLDHNVELANARIATLGERVEDVFLLTDISGQPLSDVALCQRLSDSLCSQLDNLNIQESSNGKLIPGPKNSSPTRL